ncbi:MAG: DUF418 domain-containing protein [Sphingorhabdus sp.]
MDDGKKLTRHISLDALRGFAVMGILAMNIIAFSMPEMAYITPSLGGPPSRADLVSWIVSFILVDGKMRGLFSLLFGASMLLIVERAEAKGESAARVHFRRMGWLALIGLAHFLFIWWGDILFLYAIAGCVAYLFRDVEARGLFKMAIIIYAIGFFLMSLFTGMLWLFEVAAKAPDADAELVKSYNAMLSGFSTTAKEVAAYRGNYFDIVHYRVTEKWSQPLAMVVQNICETLPFMMIGIALYKKGFMTGEWDTHRYRKWALIGLGLGGLAYGVFAAWAVAANFDLILMMNVVIAWTYPFRLLMILGYAAALILLIRAFAQSGWMMRVAAAGRAAFSNYLGTSIVMTTIFYGYGFGLYNGVGRAQLWLFVIGAWIAMLLWSKPWLDRFRYGPFEWLWRSLARWELQPMRKAIPVSGPV